MSNNTTIARPYAKAVFEIARDSKQLANWALILQQFAIVTSDVEAIRFISNPASTPEQHSQLLLAAISQIKHLISAELINHLIQTLAQNKRLLLLPEIFTQFELLRAAEEKTLVATVLSYSPMSAEQEQQLGARLSKRLERSVTLDVTVDSSLIGGAIIRAGDLVINGSVKEQLNKLVARLAA
jgi:F-type H+-transporting ATPase subunit delta